MLYTSNSIPNATSTQPKGVPDFQKGNNLAMLIGNSNTKSEDSNSQTEPTRNKERGEASEPDAPTGAEENAGMSTILDGSLGTGVQPDADDE
jgi:hypothetical protein